MVFKLDTATGGLHQPTHARLDDPDYELWIHRNSDFNTFRSRAREKEPWTFDWLKKFNDRVILFDIGACVGSYSLMAAARGATVVAFEPLPVNARALERNITMNGLVEKITPVQVAISDEEKLTLWSHYMALTTPAGYGLAASVPQMDRQDKEIQVETLSLDGAAELYGQPTHIKVDVEGGEMGVFGSGPEVLARVTSVIVEIANDEIEAQVDDLLLAADLMGREVGNRRTFKNRTRIYV